MEVSNAPVLSTPAELILQDSSPVALPSPEARLSDEQIYVQYEIRRTVDEIRSARYKSVALQFPDEMLVDAPRIFEHLRDELNAAKPVDVDRLSSTTACPDEVSNEHTAQLHPSPTSPVSLCILADTSYGACCVDEVAAEHVDADVVVHYGRSCLSPTARLPVIYVFTSKPVDLDAVVSSFKSTYNQLDEKVCLMADIPYAHHLPELSRRLQDEGYLNIFATEIVHEPSSLLPNRTVPPEVQHNPDSLKDYSVFHISSPPTSLLLILSSRIKAMHIFPTDGVSTGSTPALEASTAQLLRRRYALITRLSTVPIFGILINTLSVSNYMTALQYCQDIIARAGKKSYVFVVGKVNAAKVANFSEIGGWVVIGCWESSLIESKEFFRPIITPFELKVALTDDSSRTWGSEWIADFGALLSSKKDGIVAGSAAQEGTQPNDQTDEDGDSSGDEPPEFDLRTGKYVSHSRPMGRRPRAAIAADAAAPASAPPASSALVQRAKGEVATIAGQFSPAAEYLRTQRTWQGLGDDHEIAYERDAQGNIVGATMEVGRSGVAKGYSVGEEESRH